MRKYGRTLLILTAVSAFACQQVDNASQVAVAIGQITAGKPLPGASAPVWKDVQAFYEGRGGAPAWVKDDDVATAAKARDLLRTANAHGFAPADYGEPGISERIEAVAQLDEDGPERAEAIAALDTRVTTALLAFGRDVALGRTSPASVDNRWKARRMAPDFARILVDTGSDFEKWIEAVRPPHPEYRALQEALVDLQGQRDKGGWAVVPAGKYGPGRSSPSMAAVRQRLSAGGHLDADAASDTSPVYSKDDEAAVRAFQELHGIKSTGVIDAATLTAMNVPIDERIRQVALNLERWRWMPDDLGDRHLFVNIPYFHLIAREKGKAVADIRVVVGKPTDPTRTPVFSSEMETVVFSPYWNIPDSIVEGETAPAVMRDSAYLVKNNIEILDLSKGEGTPVDHENVDWDDDEQLKRLAFRQRPGPGNALGHVKFLFPNEFDVYLHDTPADELFARPGRAFSHGCVRVEEPEALAKYILRGYSEWNDDTILEAMHAGVEKHVKLKEPIPVHIVYFTAWVDEKGGLHFQPDIYGYDGKA